MKNILKKAILLLATFVSASVFLFAENQSAQSLTILIRPKPTNPGGAPRVPSAVRVEAEYDDVTGSVLVYLANAGTSVDVAIENLTTGESTGDTVSGSGIAAIPISGTSGTWVITFTLLSGDIYEGEFVL